jgi:hypothetical protein
VTINDKWLWASVLQKSVRRGDTEYAMQAVTALWELDRAKLWMRLPTVALEDVGIGNPDAVTETLLAASSASARREKQTAYHVAALLCAGAKNRLSDAVFILSERSTAYHDVRQRMARTGDDTLASFVNDEKNSLVGRAIAAWLLAGTQRFYSEVMPARRGSPDMAVSVIRSLTPSTPLTQACTKNIKSSRWPLSLHLPLIAQEAMKYDTRIQHHAIPTDTMVSSLDIFTRAGRLCFRQLREAMPGLKPFTVQQIGLGIFYLDGDKVDKELTSPELEAIQRAGELTDLESAGLSEAAYMHLRELLAQHMELLTEIRHKQLASIGGQK